MRVYRAAFIPALNLAAAGIATMFTGALLWLFNADDPIVDLGGDDG